MIRRVAEHRPMIKTAPPEQAAAITLASWKVKPAGPRMQPLPLGRCEDRSFSGIDCFARPIPTLRPILIDLVSNWPNHNDMPPPTWTLDGFVEHFAFVHDKMLDHKYAWILGAGASYASGIPLGGQLVDSWLAEIHKKEDGGKTPVEQWATPKTLEITNFRFANRASFYPQIYQRRFQNYPEEGYAYLEDLMSGKDPSPGYSILAAALGTDPPRHNVVITTNFDNLVSDALSIYTDTFPFVCGHESLTAFVRVAMRRPLICKIHRDLLLGPQNDPRSMRRLHDAWGLALRSLFQHYTPLFIGYGGNDDTLMDLLESLQPTDIKGQLIWCYHESAGPSERIANVVGDLQGVLVPVPDFDLLMVLLGEKLGVALLDEEIGRRAEERTKRYRDRIQQLDTIKYPSVTKALSATLERSGGWWVWQQKATRETEASRSEIVFRQGLQHCPESWELHNNFAVFLRKAGRSEEAETYYRRAYDLNPKEPVVLGNLSQFILSWKCDEVEAEKLFREAGKANPYQPSSATNYAEFLLLRDRTSEASQVLTALEQKPPPKHDYYLAILFFLRAVTARVQGANDAAALAGLASAFTNGFDRANITYEFSELLEFIKRKLTPEDHALFSALAQGILDSKRIPNIGPLQMARDAAIHESSASDPTKTEPESPTKKNGAGLQSRRAPDVSRKPR